VIDDPEEITERRRSAGRWYEANAGRYGAFAAEIERILRFNLDAQTVVCQSVSHRTKTLESFTEKCLRPAKDDGRHFKYHAPLDQITDVAGVRVVTYLSDGVAQVERVLRNALRTDGPEAQVGANDPAVPGYRGVHYLVEMSTDRLALPEFAGYRGLRAEVQIQTVLQHAWAEIQHDIMYKGDTLTPAPVRRRLVALAGMLELADAEFRQVSHDLDLVVQESEEATAPVAGNDDRLDVVRLRSLLHEHLGGADRLEPVWLDQSMTVLSELGLEKPGDVLALLHRQSGNVDGLRAYLVRPGYMPGPVEVLDGLLRLELGQAYLDRRAGFRQLSEQAQTRAREGITELQARAVP